MVTKFQIIDPFAQKDQKERIRMLSLSSTVSQLVNVWLAVIGIFLSSPHLPVDRPLPRPLDEVFIVNVTRGEPTASAVEAVADSGGQVLQAWESIGVLIVEVRDRAVLEKLAGRAEISSIGEVKNEFPYDDPESEEEGAGTPPEGASPAPSIEAEEPEILETQDEEELEPIDEDDPLWRLGAVNALDVDTTGAGATVAVLDSGIDATHPDLAHAVSQQDSVDCSEFGVPALSKTGPLVDPRAHGTAVAGIIAASGNNPGVAGIAPDATLLSMRVINSENKVNAANLVCGLVSAVDRGANVATMSFGLDPWKFWGPNDPGYSAVVEALTRATLYAESNNVTLVASVGNEGADFDFVEQQTGKRRLPVSLEGVIGVGSINRSLTRSNFSNFGSDVVDLMAPGNGIYSTWPNSEYGINFGTSFATPHVSAVVALLKAADPELSGDEIAEILFSTATDLGEPGRDGDYGHGLLNARAAVDALGSLAAS